MEYDNESQSEQVWKITGFNRHPSLVERLKEDLVPIFKSDEPLDIASVPCSTGVEALAIAIGLERNQCAYRIHGYDVDNDAIRAAINGSFFLNPLSGQIIGDAISGYDYQWSNLSHDDRVEFFEEYETNGRTTIKAKPHISSKLKFTLLGIESLPETKHDIVLCLNFLRYLTDNRFSNSLPCLDSVSNSLFRSTKPQGALLIDPKSDKTPSIDKALQKQGYSRIFDCTYIKC